MPSRSQLVCQLCIVRTVLYRSARHRQRPTEKPAAEQCLGKMCQQDTLRRVGHINGEKTSQGKDAGYQCGFCVDAAGPAGPAAVSQSGWSTRTPPNQIASNTNKGIFCPEQPFCKDETSFCTRCISGEFSRGCRVRIRCPIGPTDSPQWLTLDHCSSLAFSHCHKSLSPQLCFRRRIYRICDPSAIWADPCDRICRPVPARQLWGGVNSRAQLF